MSGTLKIWDGAAWVNTGRDGADGAAGASGVLDYINLQHQEANGVQGGGSTAGSWLQLVVNTEVNDAGSRCSLSSNRFTLDAGTYQISATQMGIDACLKLRLYNFTDSATVLVGTNNYSLNSGGAGSGDAAVRGIFTIGASKALELQYWALVSIAVNGLGSSFTTGEIEVYTIIELWKRA